MTNTEKNPKQTIQELKQQIKELQHENERLEKINEAIAQQNKEFGDLLLKARAQLQLFKEVAKTQYFTTLNLKEI